MNRELAAQRASRLDSRYARGEMRLAIVVFALGFGLAFAGCAFVPGLLSSPSPGSSGPEDSGFESVEPASSDIPLAQIVGAWVSAPLRLGDPQIAVVSDACAIAARNQLGAAEADLPTAVVDARGEGFATAILADDTRAIQCLARLDGAGTARIDGAERLAPSTVAKVADQAIGLTSLLQFEDREGGRTFLIGRVGPNASEVKAVLGDRSEVGASLANGWYAAWWPGDHRATAIHAVYGGSEVVRAVEATTDQVDGRLGAASWWLDPTAPAPTADSTSIQALVLEEACASGKSAKDRLEAPLIDLSETAVTVTFGIRPLPGSQDCQGNDPVPVTFQLPEALAERTLFDGNEVPPREAARPPTG
jgi:hypothetical protein